MQTERERETASDEMAWNQAGVPTKIAFEVWNYAETFIVGTMPTGILLSENH